MFCDLRFLTFIFVWLNRGVSSVASVNKSQVSLITCENGAGNLGHRCMRHWLLLLLSSVSPLCRVSTLIFLRRTMSLGNTVLQLFWCNYSWCIYCQFLRWLHCISTLALSEVCVQCPIWLFFCCFLTSWFPGMLLTYFVNEFKMVPVAPLITGVAFGLHSTCFVFLL